MTKLLIALLFPLTSFGADITIKGVCQSKISPDVFGINVEVSSLEKEMETSFKETNKKFTKLVNYYKQKFIVNTESVNTFEEYDYSSRKKVSLGYRTTMRASLESKDKKEMEKGLYHLSKFKDVKISGLKTEVSSEKLKEEKDACFLLSVNDAMNKAKKVAKNIGEKVNKIKEIRELDGFIPSNPRPMFGTQMLKSSERTPLEVKDQDLRVEVLMTVETVK